jgi:hypothetical protein
MKPGVDNHDHDPTNVGRQSGAPPPVVQPPPDVAFHIYGLTLDTSDPSINTRITAALSSAAANLSGNPGVLVVSANDYGSVVTIPTLSFGIWLSPTPTDATAKAERLASLLGTRTPGISSGGGEIKVREGLLSDFVFSKLPKEFDEGGTTGQLTSCTLTQIAPCGLAIAVAYQLAVPVVYPTVSCSTTLSFMQSGGSVQLSVSNLACGDFGVFNAILSTLFTPGLFQVLETGLAAFAYVVINRLGSGLSALPDLSIPLPVPNDIASLLFPREIPVGPAKLSLSFLDPSIAPAITGPGPFWFRFTWNLMLRLPQAAIQGPATLIFRVEPPISNSEKKGSAEFHVTTVDLTNPSFEWSLDGHVVANTTANFAQIAFDASTLAVNQSRAFTVTVIATDGADSSLTANATYRVNVSVIRGRIGQ